MMDVAVRYRPPGGQQVLQQQPRALRGVPLEELRSLSVVRTYRGRSGIATNWWSATTGALVMCSTLGLQDTAMLLDLDPDVTGFASAPAEVVWSGGGRSGTITPAFFARTVDRQRLAVMRPWRAGPDGQAEEEIMRGVAQDAHWTVTVPRLPLPVRMASLRRVARFRLPEYHCSPEARAALLEAFARPRPLVEGAAAAGQPTGRAWHLLWTGDLAADETAPLLPVSLVWATGKDSTL